MFIRVFAVALCLTGCAPKSTTSAGVPFAGKYAVNWPVLTSDACAGGCEARAYWTQTPTWSVDLTSSSCTVDVETGRVDADVAGDALNFTLEVPVLTPGCSGDGVYIVTLAPESSGCQVDIQARFAVTCDGVMRVCACEYTATGDRML